MSFSTNKSDVTWSFISTIVGSVSGFILLPLLMKFLTSDELGLWYVYVAISNLAMLFEFGFNPTFARNIVYVISGARRLSSTGCDMDSVEEGIDWHLLAAVIKCSKIVYACIAIVVTFVCLSFGTYYVWYISSSVDSVVLWSSWLTFCISIFLNIYFLYKVTVLRGCGDVAGENQCVVYARLVQIIITLVLLLMGAGLFGAAIGYLANGLFVRVFAGIRFSSHKNLIAGLSRSKEKITLVEVKYILSTIGSIAYKDGFVQLSGYAATQAMSILSSLFLGLTETGTYSILLQFASAIFSFATAYPKSFFPSFQSYYADGNYSRLRAIVAKGIRRYWALSSLGTCGVAFFILPLLPIVKPGIVINYQLFFALCIYLSLYNQQSVFCNYIISMNEIPYMKSSILSSCIGVAITCILCMYFHLGAYGIVFGQLLSQLVYNVWRWPSYLCHKLKFSYFDIFKSVRAK